ncbi:DUF5060 domain-containing protein [Opitutia bacterium ISCC 51]|nr:DUF5060 domain-containing protein [Opitutae bacterium ISCC 51]QXD27205.1 DUF5060 domain-containing protein [Opitutae bacterium ISCC 52]
MELADNGTNPFDRLPRARCVGPNGQQFTVPGYYTGGNNYSIRVSFPEPGNWTVSSEETDDTWQVSVSSNP